MLTKKFAQLKAIFPKWTHKFIEKKHFVFLVAFILFLAAIIAYQADPFFSKHDRKECLAASAAYDKLVNLRESPDKLIRVINRKLFLQPKYDGFLAQSYLNQGNTASARTFARRSFSRTENELPYHSRFSKSSLLIADGKFEEALQDAKKLKSEMAAVPELWNSPRSTVGPILYLYNLLRIAVLEKTMQNPKEELFAWSELENFINQAQQNSALEKITRSFTKDFLKDNRINLQEYIAARKEALKSK